MACSARPSPPSRAPPSCTAGGITAYATELGKAVLLGVLAGLLAQLRPGATPTWPGPWRRVPGDRLGATWGLATTGVAGTRSRLTANPQAPCTSRPARGVPAPRSLGPCCSQRAGTRTAGRPSSRRPETAVERARGRWPLITALRHQRTRLRPHSPSVGSGQVPVETARLTSRRGRSATMVLLRHLLGDTRCGGYACARVVPSVRSPPPPGSPSVISPRSSAVRRKRPPSSWRRSAARWKPRCLRSSARCRTTSPLAELQSEPVLVNTRVSGKRTCRPLRCGAKTPPSEHSGRACPLPWCGSLRRLTPGRRRRAGRRGQAGRGRRAGHRHHRTAVRPTTRPGTTTWPAASATSPTWCRSEESVRAGSYCARFWPSSRASPQGSCQRC